MTLATYGYDLNGSRVQKALANGTSTEYTLDDASRLTSLTDKKGATTLLSTGYTLNAVGNRTAKAQGGVSENYSFDAIDQVTGVNYNNTRNVSYDYDSVGNRTSVVDNAVTTNYSTNNLNQYTNVGGASQGFDGNGNLTSGMGIFLYDSQSRLTRAIVGSDITDFDYDSKNRVVKRSLNSVPTFLIYDGWSLIEERSNAGAVQAVYVHGTRLDEILTKTDTSGTVYYHHDGLGSTTQLTDGSGNLIEKYGYDIFGKVTIMALGGAILSVSSRGNRFFFTGREFIKEVGIYDYRNRVYSQELGRFLQTDPIRFSAKDVNIYRYCGNNGVIRNDSFGLCSTPEDEDEGNIPLGEGKKPDLNPKSGGGFLDPSEPPKPYKTADLWNNKWNDQSPGTRTGDFPGTSPQSPSWHGEGGGGFNSDSSGVSAKATLGASNGNMTASFSGSLSPSGSYGAQASFATHF